jgi:hypothetical protein
MRWWSRGGGELEVAAAKFRGSLRNTAHPSRAADHRQLAPLLIRRLACSHGPRRNCEATACSVGKDFSTIRQEAAVNDYYRPEANIRMTIELDFLIDEWKTQILASARYPAALEAQIEQFESERGPVPKEYRTFLLLGGGGAVGSEWLDGIAQLPSSHAKFVRECGQNDWVTTMFLSGWDGSGAPLGIDDTGAIVVEHEGGDLVRLAPSFHLFLQSALTG